MQSIDTICDQGLSPRPERTVGSSPVPGSDKISWCLTSRLASPLRVCSASSSSSSSHWRPGHRRAAYGGRAVQDDGRLPTRYRVASAGTAVFLTGALWLVLAAARGITPTAPSASLQGVGVWTLVGLFALNTMGNVAGRHPVERWGAGGITAVLTILCVWIALTR